MSLLWGSVGRKMTLVLHTNPNQEGRGQQDKRNVTIPANETSDLILIETEVFGRFEVFLYMPAFRQWLKPSLAESLQVGQTPDNRSFRVDHPDSDGSGASGIHRHLAFRTTGKIAQSNRRGPFVRLSH